MWEIDLNCKNDLITVENLKTGEIRSLNEMGFSFLKKTDDSVKTKYPGTFKELEIFCGKGDEFIYARVRQFIACNFTSKDGHPDIDEDFNFIIEKVACPAKITGICKHSFCKPTLTHVLSDREVEVLRLFAKGFDEAEISEALFISKNTVHNHINNMYKKIEVVGKSSPDRKLVNFAHTKGII